MTSDELHELKPGSKFSTRNGIFQVAYNDTNNHVLSVIALHETSGTMAYDDLEEAVIIQIGQKELF
jgi:hypothetical protein